MTPAVTMKLGRRAVKHVPARRLLAHSVLAALPDPPNAVDNSGSITNWGMMLNDTLGDCTCAGLGHSIQVATLLTSRAVTPSDSVVLAAYEQFCNYNPIDPSTDQGGVETDILTDLMKVGFAGYALPAWCSPDPRLVDNIKKTVAYFGSAYIGASMPLSAQPPLVGPWDVVPGPNGVPGGWGGHCMVVVAYDAETVTFITWGGLQKATWAWFLAYVDEVHALYWDVPWKAFSGETAAQVEAALGGLGSLDS